MEKSSNPLPWKNYNKTRHELYKIWNQLPQPKVNWPEYSKEHGLAKKTTKEYREHEDDRGNNSKRCFGCDKWKPFDMFYKNDTTWDKLNSSCIDCHKKSYEQKKENIPPKQEPVQPPINLGNLKYCSMCYKNKQTYDFYDSTIAKVYGTCRQCRERGAQGRAKKRHLADTLYKSESSICVKCGKPWKPDSSEEEQFSVCLSCRIKVQNWKKDNKMRLGMYSHKYYLLLNGVNVHSWFLSQHNTLYPSRQSKHVEINGVMGKLCSKRECGWQPLTYFKHRTGTFDNLSSKCQKCEVTFIFNKKQVRRRYVKRRIKIDINFAIAIRYRSRIYSAFSRYQMNKTDSTNKLLGCSFNEYKIFLQSNFEDGMSWENRSSWHIDHILPISLFNLRERKEREICFNYKNTIPLWKEDNLKKGKQITIKDLNLIKERGLLDDYPTLKIKFGIE